MTTLCGVRIPGGCAPPAFSPAQSLQCTSRTRRCRSGAHAGGRHGDSVRPWAHRRPPPPSLCVGGGGGGWRGWRTFGVTNHQVSSVCVCQACAGRMPGVSLYAIFICNAQDTRHNILQIPNNTIHSTQYDFNQYTQKRLLSYERVSGGGLCGRCVVHVHRTVTAKAWYTNRYTINGWNKGAIRVLCFIDSL